MPALIGSRIPRVEDEALLRGRGRFVDDVAVSGVLHAAFVRSPHPHALIRKVSIDAAAALPGVHAVLTLDDLQPVLAQRRMNRRSNSGAPLDKLWPFALADRETSYVGEPVAIVLADDRYAAEDAARRSGALLYVPSGGIGGLDALKAACAAGVDEVSIQVAKPPAAWKGIPYVAALGVDLDQLQSAHTLFEGPAREGVPHFPQNVNIAAVLSLAGIGWDRTRLTVVADPALTRNTHTIRVAGASGRFTVVLENVPAPENPKTSWLACYSALAALKSIQSPVRYGT